MSTKKKRLEDIEYVEGSSNVFADLGIPEPEEAMAKAKANPRNYGLLEDLNTRPRTTYLAAVRNPNPVLEPAATHGGPGHGTTAETH